VVQIKVRLNAESWHSKAAEMAWNKFVPALMMVGSKRIRIHQWNVLSINSAINQANV